MSKKSQKLTFPDFSATHPIPTHPDSDIAQNPLVASEQGMPSVHRIAMLIDAMKTSFRRSLSGIFAACLFLCFSPGAVAGPPPSVGLLRSAHITLARADHDY
jgi:hypothetical protein